jgi:anti-sigma-K factor RskA
VAVQSVTGAPRYDEASIARPRPAPRTPADANQLRLLRSVIVASGMPFLDDAATYQLWAMTEDGPRSAGTFNVDRQGDVRERLSLPGDPVDGWRITIEPRGGSPAPTTQPVYSS